MISLVRFCAISLSTPDLVRNTIQKGGAPSVLDKVFALVTRRSIPNIMITDQGVGKFIAQSLFLCYVHIKSLPSCSEVLKPWYAFII